MAFLLQVGLLLVIGVVCLWGLRVLKRREPLEVRTPQRGTASLLHAPRPAGPVQTPLAVNGEWTLEQCAELLERVIPGQELQFYAADHRSPTDPGGYVRVQRSESGVLIRKVANHGWSSSWERIDLSELRDELYRNRTEQTVILNRAVLTAAYRQEAEGNR